MSGNAPDNLEIELERTFLARTIPPEIKNVAPIPMLDIYVPEKAARPHIRLRQKGSEYEITKKQPVDQSDFSRQTEQTIPLDEDEFKALARASDRRVEKLRYKVNIDGVAAEVDVFRGRLQGLVLIDFEFTDAEAMAGFTPPKCCLVEVTQELFIAGGQLAGKSYEDIALDLARFDYKALDFSL